MKPQWLKDREKQKLRKEPDKCCDCRYFGKIIGETKHKGKERCMIHECDLHQGCFNTRFSYVCDDFSSIIN